MKRQRFDERVCREDEMLMCGTAPENLSVAWTVYFQVVMTGSSPCHGWQIKLCNFIRVQLQISGLREHFDLLYAVECQPHLWSSN